MQFERLLNLPERKPGNMKAQAWDLRTEGATLSAWQMIHVAPGSRVTAYHKHFAPEGLFFALHQVGKDRNFVCPQKLPKTKEWLKHLKVFNCRTAQCHC